MSVSALSFFPGVWWYCDKAGPIVRRPIIIESVRWILEQMLFDEGYPLCNGPALSIVQLHGGYIPPRKQRCNCCAPTTRTNIQNMLPRTTEVGDQILHKANWFLGGVHRHPGIRRYFLRLHRVTNKYVKFRLSLTEVPVVTHTTISWRNLVQKNELKCVFQFVWLVPGIWLGPGADNSFLLAKTVKGILERLELRE